MATSARVPVAGTDHALNTRELREKYMSYINADPALVESRRWIEEVTRRGFKSHNFRESLADGILLCELIEIVGDLPLGRINRLPTVYAGIDNLNLFFKACERLGLKKLHLFDVTDLQEVTPRRGDSTSSRAKETERRLQNVAITILWLAKAAQNQGYQGPALDFSCFDHLLPEVHVYGKRERQARKRHSVGDLENKSRRTGNIPPSKRDRVFDNINIKDRKEKFRNLENESKKELVALELNRRKSTGGILKRIKDKHWDEEEGKSRQKENKQSKLKMPDPKFHEKQELYKRREKQPQTGSAVLEDKTRGRRDSESGRVTSPPPISLGRKVEVDLKEKQRRFEGLDRKAEQQSAVLSGKTRPVSWGSDIRPSPRKQTSVDIGFKDKHKNYEQLQRQATTESAVLQGKLRPQFDKADGRPEKVPLATKTDVKLWEKQKDFEQRDYQAQREKAVLEGNLRLSPGDSNGKKSNSVVIPKQNQVKLDEKKATFEQLDRQAEQDTSILRGERRPVLTETDGHKRSSKVGFPKASSIGLQEKQRTFEDMDYQARKESEILQKNKRKSFGSSVKEPALLSTSTRPQIARFQSPSDRMAESSDVTRRNQQERPSRPVSNYYEYSSFQSDYPQSGKVYENATSEDPVTMEEPLQSAPSYECERINYNQKEDGRRVAEDRRRDYSEYVRRRYEESRRRRSSGEEPLEIDISDGKNLSYRDMVRAPPKKSRETFIRETGNVVEEEMPWRKEVREVRDKRHLSPEEEQEPSYAARPGSPRSDLGKAQYLELGVPPSKRAMDNFGDKNETTRGKAEEMPWRKEVKEINRSLSGGEPSTAQAQPAEFTRIRPSSLKMRDTFVTTKENKREDEMPWRKEVRELKERPRPDDEEDYRNDNTPHEIDFSTAPNLRKLSYKEFINVPARKQRDIFHPEDAKSKDKDEMPWRKEVREIKRTATEEHEEQLVKSFVTLAQSAPEHDYKGPAYHEQVPKPSRIARDSFVPYEDKQREEMPWRKEVREMKRTITDDEQVQLSSTTNSDASQADKKDMRKFSYRDFVDKPRKKSDSFLPSEEKENEEMPWRKEVRELREKPVEEEQISQSSRSELESATNDAFYGNIGRPSQNAYYEDKRDSSRNGSYRGGGVQNMSYKDFISPPSKPSQSHGQVQRRSTKVKDLTQKFANIEAEKHRPKQSGLPSRKSLVDIAELQRIERDMKTRSWHGFPASAEYDSDDDYDARLRQRTRRQEDEEERFRQQQQRENVSGLEELDDVFQDPEGYFDQMQGPPPERKVEEEVHMQYETPPWEERDERKAQIVTVRSIDDQYGQTPLYASHNDYSYQPKPFSDGRLQKRKPSDDRVVVKQTWIQPNRVELSKPSLDAPGHAKQDYIPRDNGQFTSQHYTDERPQWQDYQKNEPYITDRENLTKEESLFSKRSDFNEDKCFIEHNEYPRDDEPYYPEYNSFRDQNQFSKENEYWMPREVQSDPRQQRAQLTKTPAKNDGGMVFGGPIVVTARRSQQSGKPEDGHQQFGTYDLPPAEVKPYETKNGTMAVRYDREPAEDCSYDNRDNTLSIQNDLEKIKNARNLVLQDIKNIGKKDTIGPSEEPKMVYRPHVFGVFARSDPRETERREDPQERQSSDLLPKDSFQEMRRGNMLYLNENEHESLQDSKTMEETEDNSWNLEDRRQYFEEGNDYENTVSNNTELHPTVVSMVESQTQQWGSGAFDVSPQKDEQRPGRSRVMNFEDDHEDEAALENKDEPVQIQFNEKYRRQEQKEKEEVLREQLRDAEYREKYRKEFEEKNRKQRENSKYLMNLQMRAALTPDEDVDYSEDTETQREVEQQQSQDKGNVSDEDLAKVVAAEEDYWHKKMEKKARQQNKEASHERPRRSDDLQPRVNGIDFVGEDKAVHREYKDPDHEARLRKLKAEEEFMAQEADRLVRERAALKQQTQVEEPVIAPVEKPSVEFTVNEEALKSILAEDNRGEDSVDENRNRYLSKKNILEQVDVVYSDEEYPPQKETELREWDNISKPQAQVLPINGYHNESKAYPEAQHGDFSENSGTDPEVNGFEGYSIYETFIHGESNHVICMSCGTSIEKSAAMYIAELDRYWHVNCFSCVVCRTWFGDEYSPVLHITDSMLHCERCYITSEGERCTEV